MTKKLIALGIVAALLHSVKDLHFSFNHPSSDGDGAAIAAYNDLVKTHNDLVAEHEALKASLR